MNISLSFIRNLAYSKAELGCALLCLVAIFIGVLARFDGLGIWSIADDEYYIAKSVELILKNGFPFYPDGGMYSRALLFQYIEVASVSLFGFNEYALRLPPVLFNLASIFPLYWLAKKRISVSGAFLLVAFFSVSMWEVEFSRFARMYSMLQCAFLWFLYYYHEGFFLGENRAIFWSYVIAGISIFIHAGSIFMALLLFLPLFFRGGSLANQLRIGIRASSLLLLNVAHHKWLSWVMGASGNPYPKGFIPQHHDAGGLLWPNFSLWQSVFLHGGLWEVGYFILALIGLGIGYSVLIFHSWDWRQKFISLLLLTCGLLQLYGMVFFLLLIAYLTETIPLGRFIHEVLVKRIVIFVIASIGYWVAFGFFTSTWHSLVSIPQFSWYKLLSILIHYPRLGDQFIIPWLDVMPYFLIVSCFFGLIILWNTRKSENFLQHSFLLLLLAGCLVILGLLDTRSHTRYSFFLYPVILLLWFEGAKVLKPWIVSVFPQKANMLGVYGLASVFIPFGLLLTTEDFSFFRLMNIGKAEVNYRMNVTKDVASHYYLRDDFKAPAEYINEQWRPGDIIINMALPAAFYLTPNSYVFYDQKSTKFYAYARRNGTKERWGFSLVYDKETVQAAVQSVQGVVWILAKNDPSNRSIGLTQWVKDAFKNTSVNIEILSPGFDKRIQIAKVMPEDNG